ALAVEVDGVVKNFGRIRALDGVQLAVRQGEVFGLLGPNGSGKTTLIRCMVCLVVPDAGTVTVVGGRLAALGGLSRGVYMTQAAALHPDLPVLENLRFFAAISGGDRHVNEALEFVELADRRHSVVATLSGGMRTRASLACAIVHRPELLLLDEPTVGIDPLLRAPLWDRLHPMTASGTTIVVSSHVMDEAARCDRLGLILFGRLLAEGSVSELLAMAGTDHLEDAFLKLSRAV